MRALSRIRHGRDLVTLAVAAMGVTLGACVGAARADERQFGTYKIGSEIPSEPPGTLTTLPDGSVRLSRDRWRFILHDAEIAHARADELDAAREALAASERVVAALTSERDALRMELDATTRDRDALRLDLTSERAAVLRVTRSRRRWRAAAFGGLAFIAGGYAAARVLP